MSKVTLVSRDNFSLFTPMLHEVVASDLEPADICNPLRKLLPRVTVLTGEVKAIDLAARRVTISYGLRVLKQELPFDYLVLALGSETNYLGNPGRGRTCAGEKNADQRCVHASGWSTRNAGRCQALNPIANGGKRMLTFVVAGGGFAGVETVGAINDLARESLQYYDEIICAKSALVIDLIDGGPVILPELGEALGLYAQEKLRRRQSPDNSKLRSSRTPMKKGGPR